MFGVSQMFNLKSFPFISRLVQRHSREPLLDVDEIKGLAASLQLDHQHDSAMRTCQLYAGSQQSSHRGEGMDFLENRQYLVGDNPRHINWRLSARLGSLHTRVFQEDKQSQTLVITDRRPAMWFGTQQQLKVKQAVNSAILFMFAATKRHHAFASLQIDKDYRCSDFQSGDSLAIKQAQQLARVDNKVDLATVSVSLAETLSYVLQVYPVGNEIILISNFSDLDKRACGSLNALAQHNDVTAVYITDPADTCLPRAGSIDTVSISIAGPVAIDTSDPLLRAHYHQVGEQKKQSIIQSLTQNNAFCIELSTAQDAWQVLRGVLR